jgi:hypothetical protein
VKLSEKILNPQSAVLFKGRAVEIQEGDAGVALARAAIEAARIQADMNENLSELQRARNAAAARANIRQAEDLPENEQARLDAEYFNDQQGMQM